MPRKQTQSVQDMLGSLKNTVGAQSITSGVIPDIITFCEHKDYLGLPFQDPPIKLYPMQKLIIKAFYRGSVGNEKLVFTPEEIQLLKKHKLDNDDNGDVIAKMATGNIFRELVLVWGRRSGKDFVISIIALYEAMKLLEAEGGDPYKKYGLSPANPITILTIATAAPQATLAFQEMKAKMLQSKYFADKFIGEGITQSEIYLITPKDKLDNVEYTKKKLPLKRGSILIQSGHSNSDSMLGKGCFVLLLDEVASFGATGSASSGDRIYTALTPAVNTYNRTVCDQCGNKDRDYFEQIDDHIVCKTCKANGRKIYDGKIVSISSPRGKDGIFWDLFSKASKPEAKDRVVCRLPTWIVNPNHTRESLRASNTTMTDDEFEQEFGAQFSGTGGENMFSEEIVTAAFEPKLKNKEGGVPGIVYFAHLDPALSNHNYAMCILHKEVFFNLETRKMDFFIVVDHVKIWTPSPGNPVKIDDVDKYVLEMNKWFHFGLVTYDQMFSHTSIAKMKRAGMPCTETRFNSSYQMNIYGTLDQLLINGRVKIPSIGRDYEILRNEMYNLQREYYGRGWRVHAKRDGEVRTDDACDALAAATWNAINATTNKLPQTKLAHLPLNPSSGNRQWMSMQGTSYGYGSGSAVANQMRRHHQIPPKGQFGSF